jgi:hypothetical protein
MAAISLRRQGPQLDLDETGVRAWQQEWARQHYLVLPGFLERALLDEVRYHVSHGRFATFIHDASGHEAVWLLDFLMNSPSLLDAVSRITGRELTFFHGRVYRLSPGSDEGHDWHNDAVHGRQVGVSINLTSGAFTGGGLEFRDHDSHRPLGAVTNNGAGALVMFRLGHDIQHRVLPVTGATTRLAYAGWFYSGAGLRERLVRQPE